MQLRSLNWGQPRVFPAESDVICIRSKSLYSNHRVNNNNSNENNHHHHNHNSDYYHNPKIIIIIVINSDENKRC